MRIICDMRLPAFRLPFFFVARIERSEIRDRPCSFLNVPGFRFAQSGLRFCKTRAQKNASRERRMLRLRKEAPKTLTRERYLARLHAEKDRLARHYCDVFRFW